MNYFFYIVESPTYKQNDVNYVNMVFWRIIIVFILQMSKVKIKTIFLFNQIQP